MQTSSSELGTTVTNEQIEALPLNGRNFVNLTRTVPGRAARHSRREHRRRRQPGLARLGVVLGQRPARRATTTSCSTASTTTRPGCRRSSSSRASTRSTSSSCRPRTYSAEFGRSLGGVVNLQIKSGTNQLHGSGFEFLRNDAFDANNFFNNRAGRAKPDFKQNQFGGTLGGAGVQGQDVLLRRLPGPPRERRGRRSCRRCRRWRCARGDFSELNRVIYDPTDRPAVPGQRHSRRAASITVAQNILTQLYPEPNTAGTRSANGQTINNYLINPIKERQDNQFDIKVDHNLTSTNRFFARYSYEKTHRVQPATLPHGDAGFTFGAGDGNIKAQGLAFNDTHTLQLEPG